ncbi:MAG: hypothetical protein KatS3mg096_058 [Candidatus Parcubacteria bacterium]|nr:MAG: hypothetical protein KatS3mg096_058 [Candidatus Parcubacteria bacterium]
MKKFIISIIIIFSAILLIGSLEKKREFTITHSFNNKKSNEKNLAENKNNDSQQTNSDFLISIQDKINSNLESLISKLTPDQDKSMDRYNEEINQLLQKYKAPDIQNLDSDYFINIAKELANINPPLSLYEQHLELIRYYYTAGFILKEIQQTNSFPEKIILAEYLKTFLRKIKSSQ